MNSAAAYEKWKIKQREHDRKMRQDNNTGKA